MERPNVWLPSPGGHRQQLGMLLTKLEQEFWDDSECADRIEVPATVDLDEEDRRMLDAGSFNNFLAMGEGDGIAKQVKSASPSWGGYGLGAAFRGPATLRI